MKGRANKRGVFAVGKHIYVMLRFCNMALTFGNHGRNCQYSSGNKGLSRMGGVVHAKGLAFKGAV